MNQAKFFEVVGYFANPIRNTRIEIEARQRTITHYAPTYLAQTGSPLPVGNDAVYILSDDANKWGREMRLYFTCANVAVIPAAISGMITIGGRPGYDLWNQRLNSKDIIDELFEYNFIIGDPQNEGLIRSSVPPAYMADFNSGYSLP